MTVLAFIIVVVLITVSAYFAAVETAVTAASPGKIRKAKSDGDTRAHTVLELLKIKESVISSLLIVNSMINTIATTIATSTMIALFGQDGTIIASAVMAVMIIAFAEVIPKAIAVAKAEPIILSSSHMVIIALKILYPINFALKVALKIFCAIFRIKLTHDISGTDEVRGIIAHHLEEGNVFKSDGEMLGGVLDIGNMTVSEIMVHRSHMVTIDASTSTKDITSQALLSPYTRIPLWRKSRDNIIGILHIKDLVRALYKQNFDYSKINVDQFISEPWFVPENALVSHQLHSFRKKRSHLAIVIDEYGDMLGMVTLEDILEEIVGQIDDEHDNVHERIVAKNKNRFVIDGSTPIRDVNRELGWNARDQEITGSRRGISYV